MARSQRKPDGRPSRATLHSLLGLCALVLLAYSPVLTGARIWDDHLLLEQNPVVSGKAAWTEAFRQPFLPFEAYYRPVTALALRTLNGIGGGATWPFHLFSTALHLAVTLFVFALARRVRLGTRAALAAAALFALHPALTEAVAWISGLGDLLAAVFMGGTVLALLRALAPAGAEAPPDREGRAPRTTAAMIALSMACFLAALLSKETAAGVVVVLLWIAWTAGRDRRTRAGRLARSSPVAADPGTAAGTAGSGHLLAPVIAALASIAVLGTYVGLRSAALHLPAGALFHEATSGSASGSGSALGSPAVRLILLARYARLWIAPVDLRLAYVLDAPRGAADPRIWAGIAAVLGFTAVAVFTIRRARAGRPANRPADLLVPVLWFAATIAPAAFFTPPGTSPFSERYLYIPSAGLMILIAAFAAAVAPERWKVSRRGLVIAGSVLLLLLVVRMAWRAAEWRNEETMLARTHAREPRAAGVAANLGFLYRQSGRPAEAITVYDRTLEQVAGDPRLLLTGLDRESLGRIAYEDGILLAQQGVVDRAEAALRTSLLYRPGDERTTGTLGALLGQAGRLEEAKEVLEAGVRAHPESAFLRGNLALCLRKLGDDGGAAAQYEAVLRARPDDAQARRALEELRGLTRSGR